MNKLSLKQKNINGLRVLFISGLPVNSVAITAHIAAGFRYDPVGKEGLAHFTEHMLFNGTKKYPSHRLEAEALEKYGGWHTAFTWVDDQYHSVKVPSQNISLGISLILDSLYSPLLKTKTLIHEKNVVLEEINNTRSNSNYALWDEVWIPLFFQNTNLTKSYSGTPESIENFTLNDVKKFLQKYFTPQNTVLSIAGNDLSKAEEIVSKEMQKYHHEVTPVGKTLIEISKRSKFKQTKNKSDIDNSEIGIGFSSVPFNSSRKRIGIDILKDMIGGYFGTNLITTLKEKGGLVYTWRILQENFLDSGYVIFQTSCSNKNADKVISIILSEFERIASGKFSEKEVSIAKGHLSGSLIINTEKPEDFNSWYASQQIKNVDTLLSIHDYIEIVNNISLDELKAIAKKFMATENILISVLGNANMKRIEKEHA